MKKQKKINQQRKRGKGDKLQKKDHVSEGEKRGKKKIQVVWLYTKWEQEGRASYEKREKKRVPMRKGAWEKTTPTARRGKVKPSSGKEGGE